MIHVHIVTFNSAPFIERCVRAVFESEGEFPEGWLSLSIVDNASTDGTQKILENLAKSHPEITCIFNEENLGFCAGQNQGVSLFMSSGAKYFLALNPDVALQRNTLFKLIEALTSHPEFDAATPLLLQSDSALCAFQPERIDAAGMILTKTLRHFDRFSGELLGRHTLHQERVFGGTGACLLLSRRLVEKVSFRLPEYDGDMFRIYPQLKAGASDRVQLFDEAYFAYRDDADLALRAARFDCKYLFVPEAVANHKRLVVPENRDELPAFINALGVKNRFLLQLTNLSPIAYWRAFFHGFLFRNILVILAVLVRERSSFRAFKEVLILFRRCRERYTYVERHASVSQHEAAHLME